MSEINTNNGSDNILSKADQILMSKFPFLFAIWKITPEVQERVSHITGGKSLEEVYPGTIGEILSVSNKVN